MMLAHHHKSNYQIPRLFGRHNNSRGDCSLVGPMPATSLLSSRNVLAATSVKRHHDEHRDEIDDGDNERDAADLASFLMGEMPFSQSEKNHPNMHSNETVKEIEKWLKNTNDSISSSGLNIRNNSRENIESFLTEQLPEVFCNKDAFTEDNDIIGNKLNTNYDTIFNKLHNENFSTASEKNDVYILPDLRLGDIILDEIIMPSTSVHSPYNNRSYNVGSRDLSKELDENVSTINHSDETVKDAQIPNDMIDNRETLDGIDNFEDYENENFYNISLATNFEDLLMENLSSNCSGMDDLNYSTNFESKNNCNSTVQECDNLILQSSVQKKN